MTTATDTLAGIDGVTDYVDIDADLADTIRAAAHRGPVARPTTDKQARYIAALLRERDLDGIEDGHIRSMRYAAAFPARTPRDAASYHITTLRNRPTHRQAATARAEAERRAAYLAKINPAPTPVERTTCSRCGVVRCVDGCCCAC